MRLVRENVAEFPIDKAGLSSFTHGGKEATVCKARKRIISVKKEEVVRQSVLVHLFDKMKIPQSMIEVEVPLKHLGVNSRDRADIVIYGLEGNTDDLTDTRKPIVIIECKSDDLMICQEHLDQVYSYAKRVGTRYAILTNIDESYMIDMKVEKYHKKVPTYKKMMGGTGLNYHKTGIDSYDEVTWPGIMLAIKREQIQDMLGCMSDYFEVTCQGEDSPEALVPLTVGLSNLLYRLDGAPVKNIGGYEVDDLGTRWTKYGNAGGGTYEGRYRAFHLKDKSNAVVSFSTFATEKTKNHPHWGNRKSRSYLNVSLDSVDQSHNSLQLCLDKYCYLREAEGSNSSPKKDFSRALWVFSHDGALTAGRKGSQKRSVAIEVMRKMWPDSIIGNKIALGDLPADKDWYWKDDQVQDLFKSLIRYALVRDDIRASI